MTHEYMDKEWDVMVAFHERRLIQEKSQYNNKGWYDTSEPSWTPSYTHRIKPAPRVRWLVEDADGELYEICRRTFEQARLINPSLTPVRFVEEPKE